MQSEQTEYTDKIISFLLTQTDGAIIDVKTDKQRDCLKRIMDGNFDFINNIDLTFSSDMKRIKVCKLNFKNKYEVVKDTTLFGAAF